MYNKQKGTQKKNLCKESIKIWGRFLRVKEVEILKIQEYMIYEYSQVIYRIAYNYFGNREDAEDIMQEVILKLLTAEREFDSEDHVRNWVIRCSVNECHSLFRTAFRKKRASFEDNYAVSDDWDEDIGEIECVRQALKNTSPKYRIILYLYYYEEYSVKEIAKMLKRSESTVQTWLARGRKQMKEILKEGFDE